MIKAWKSCDKVIEDETKKPGARWFPGARLNFAENLLRSWDDHTALVFRGEDKKVSRIPRCRFFDGGVILLFI